MSTDRPLRLGVVGAGRAVRELHVPALRHLRRQVRVVGVASRTVEGAEALCRELARQGLGGAVAAPTVQHLLDDQRVDAVLVAPPIALTAGITERALRAGKHVLAEKPLAESVERAVELWRLAREHDVVLAVGENFRFQPDYRRVRDLVDSGRIGTPYLYFLNDLHFTSPDSAHAAAPWRRSGAHRGGYLVDGGVHIVAGMRSLVNRAVTHVHGLSAAVHPEYLSGQPDTLLLNLRFSQGLIGHLALGYGAFDVESRHPKIYGDRGTLVLMPEAIELWQEPGRQQVAPRSHDQGFDAEWAAFLAAVRGEAEWEPLVRDAVVDLAVVLAGVLSARRGDVVALEELLRGAGVPP